MAVVIDATLLVAITAEEEARLSDLWAELQTLPIRFHPLRDPDRVASVALSQDRKSAYDAAYLALGVELTAPVWTLDRRLVANAVPLGFDVQLLT